jgi:membrane-associated phospholipid phosphatase
MTVMIALTMGTAVNSLLKVFWHEPRPYLLSELIIPAKCKAIEYGCPSGHTMGFMLVYMTFASQLPFQSHVITMIKSAIIVCCLLVAFNRA